MNEEDKLMDTMSTSTGKIRKGSSYVWKYCDKLSRHTVRCKLCQKVMSFHGTANVITHLQRKHNIMGKSTANCVKNPSDEAGLNEENGTGGNDSNTSENLMETTGELANDDLSNEETPGKRRKRNSDSASIVWKYCKRIGRDVVRCSICKKNLSNQGTSNLQRHLHRMHGIVMQSRYSRLQDEHQQPGDRRKFIMTEINNEYIQKFCSPTDDDHLKCNMCANIFDRMAGNEIVKHLMVTHGVMLHKTDRSATKRSYAETESTDDDDDDEDDPYEDRICNKESTNEQLFEYDENSIKKDFEIYNDGELPEDPASKLFKTETPFEAMLPQSNPLSPHSSHAVSPELNASRGVENYPVSKKLQRLKEERLRMETEYFREKAGFYRMQKYLTALQAKKVRAELEEFQRQTQQPNAIKNIAQPVDRTNSTAINYAVHAESNGKQPPVYAQ